MELFEILQSTRLILIGSALILVALELWLLYTRREAVHVYATIGMVAVAAFVVSRWLGYRFVEYDVGVLTGRIQWSGILIFAATIFLSLRAVWGLKNTRLTHFMAAYTAVLAALVWIDGVITTGEIHAFSDVFGNQLRGALATPHAPLFIVPYVGVVFVELYRIGTHPTFSAPKQHWRRVGVITILAAAAGLNDIGQVSGAIETVGMLDYVLVIAAINLGLMLAVHTETVFSTLEQTVADRTAALSATVASLSGLISGLPDMVLVVQGDRVELFNERARRDLNREGYLTIEELCHGADDASSFRALCDNATDIPSALSCTLGGGDGIPTDVVAIALNWDGKRTVIANARNTRERDAMERRLRQAEQLSALGTLAAGVAHEINNPMTFISANIEYCLEALPEVVDPVLIADHLDALKDAQEGTLRVTEIVAELKSFSRPSAHEVTRTADVGAAVDLALRITKHAIRHRTRIVVDLPETLPQVLGDKGRLSQVFVNLLTNATDAMPEGRSAGENTIHIKAERDASDGVSITVQDNGAGMDETVASKVFDPFFTTKAVGSGTGLGLAVCHNILKEMDAEIRVESVVGHGTTFVLKFSPVPTENEVEGSGALRILLVDHDQKALESSKRLLNGHDIDTARSATQGLRLIRQNDYDLIFCDIRLPDMTGLDFRDTLREDFAPLHEKLVIFTDGILDDLQGRLNTLDVAFLPKPVDPVRLESVFASVAQSTATVNH